MLHVMNLGLPAKTCSWDKKFAIFIGIIPSSLISSNDFADCVITLSFILKKIVTSGFSSNSEVAVTLAKSRPQDVFLKRDSLFILGWIYFVARSQNGILDSPSAISTTLSISLVTLSVKLSSSKV